MRNLRASEMEPAHKQRPPFECTMCNKCCHGKGGIYLEKQELPLAAAELGMSLDEFIKRYCRLVKGRYEIVVNQDGDCALLSPQGCSIHQVKPAVCRLWPYFPGLLKDAGALEEAKLICPGIRPDVSHDEFVAYAEQVMNIQPPE